MNDHISNRQSDENSRFRFGSRQLFVLTLVIAILCAWWIDRSRLINHSQLLQLRLDDLQRFQGVTQSIAINTQPRRTPLSPKAFVSLVASDDDWYALQDALVPFRTSPLKDQAVGDLLDLLADPDEDVRTRTLSALAQIKVRGEQVVPAVIPMLDDPVANVQWHAADVLSEFAGEAQEATEILKKKMLDDDCEIATHAAIVLQTIDPSVDIGPRLLELARNPIRENRWRAIRQLSNHVDKKTATPLLTNLFKVEQDEEIRTFIAEALNQLDR